MIEIRHKLAARGPYVEITSIRWHRMISQHDAEIALSDIEEMLAGEESLTERLDAAEEKEADAEEQIKALVVDRDAAQAKAENASAALKKLHTRRLADLRRVIRIARVMIARERKGARVAAKAAAKAIEAPKRKPWRKTR